MYCINCGKEINDNAMFCSGCGAKQQAVSFASAQTAVHALEKKKKGGSIKKAFIVFMIAFGIIVFGINAVKKFELLVVEDVAEQYMEKIKYGPDEQMMDELVDRFIYSSVSYDHVADYLSEKIEGEDALDIYKVVMRYMSYQITDVQKVEANHYRITIEVSNLNNKLMAVETGKKYVSRYFGNGKVGAATQLLDDLATDKSKKIASLYEEVSDSYYSTGDQQYFSTCIYTIDVQKVNGEWVPSCDEGLDSFLMDCAGL